MLLYLRGKGLRCDRDRQFYLLFFHKDKSSGRHDVVPGGGMTDSFSRLFIRAGQVADTLLYLLGSTLPLYMAYDSEMRLPLKM